MAATGIYAKVFRTISAGTTAAYIWRLLGIISTDVAKPEASGTAFIPVSIASGDGLSMTNSSSSRLVVQDTATSLPWASPEALLRLRAYMTAYSDSHHRSAQCSEILHKRNRPIPRTCKKRVLEWWQAKSRIWVETLVWISSNNVVSEQEDVHPNDIFPEVNNMSLIQVFVLLLRSLETIASVYLNTHLCKAWRYMC